MLDSVVLESLELIRVAVIGVGFMGFNHARVYAELSREGVPVELTAAVDIDYARAEKVCRIYGCKPYQDYRDVIGVVDAVSIAVPTTLHYRVAMDFIRNGVHVLVEKPIASTTREAMEMVKEAERNNIILLVGHIERFNPAVMKLRELIGRGVLGDVVTMNAKRVGPLPPRVRDVGVTIDLAIHDVDVMSFITGFKPLRVYAKTRNILHPARVDDVSIILLEFESNVIGIVETNWLTPYKLRRLTVVGSKAVAELDYIKQDLLYYDREVEARVRVDREEPLKRELRHFINCVRGVEKPLVPGIEGLRALVVVEAALESAREGSPISIPLEF